jgi:ribonuclease J
MVQTLPDPAPLKPGVLRIVPLGGIGEVGRNMTCFEIDSKILVVDCGVLFPEETQPGVDVILPDFGYLRDRMDDVIGIVLTHGHEDHIGGVPYFLRLRQDIPIFGSALTLAFTEAKLREHKITPKSQVVAEGQRLQVEGFDLEFVAVNHSIPDALAVMVRTKAGSVLHTGDFKMDQIPLDGRLTDLRAFSRFGEEGLDLFLCDSTNADIPGFTPLEKEIGPVIDSVISRSKGKVVVASFSSHVHRVQQVIHAAIENDRKVVLVGRSMVRNMQIATDMGYLDAPDGIFVELSKAQSYPQDKLVYMCTGSQGEPMAVLSRMVNLDHQITVDPGDTVILASSLIPGNENAVYRVIDGLTKLGANVVHKGNAKVHVSGHAAAGELLYCYNILKPKNVMPVHGEYRHLIANGKLAEQTGVDPERVLITEDGWVVDLKDGVAEIVGAVECGLLFVDGKTVGKITEEDLMDRRILAQEGFISIFCVVDSNGKVVVGPEIRARAFAEEDHVFDDVKPLIAAALAEAAGEGVRDPYAFQQVIRRTIGTWVNREHRRRPMIIPVVIAQ